MHDTTRRLYEASKKLKGVEGLSEVARLMRVTTQTFKNWEARGVSRNGLLDAQNIIGCNLDWLRSGVGDMSETLQNVHPVTFRSKVPVISWIQAGAWEEVQDMYQPGEADEWVESYETTASSSSFALRVSGDSMTSPNMGDVSFPEGTILIVDPNRSADSGDYVIAKDVVSQQATFKKLVSDGGRWFLKPLNPAYPTMPIDDPAIRVIGRVVESQTRRKL